jgi:hypothetical protein
MDHDEPPARPAGAHRRGYETRDADVRAIGLFAAGLVGIGIALQLALLAFLGIFRGEEPSRERVSPPVNLAEQLKALRDREDEALDGPASWVDRRAGIIRIPIDRAIDLLAERGVPAGKGPRTEVELRSHHGKQP